MITRMIVFLGQYNEKEVILMQSGCVFAMLWSAKDDENKVKSSNIDLF